MTRKIHGVVGGWPAISTPGTLPDTPGGARDRALLLLGFHGAFRRSELVALNVDDVEISREGAAVMVRRSKTDQQGKGRVIEIYRDGRDGLCPVLALETWLAHGLRAGPIFRAVDRLQRIRPGRLSDKDVARVVKRTAEAAGLDPRRYAGHSLRAGLATSAARAGAHERDIQRQTGHRSTETLRGYIQDGERFRRGPLVKL